MKIELRIMGKYMNCVKIIENKLLYKYNNF